eukprot:9799-Heterococcus_DN1.PRE.1
MLNVAGAYRRLAAAKWLRQQGAEWPAVLKYESRAWNTDVVQWARDEGCTSPTTPDTPTSATKAAAAAAEFAKRPVPAMCLYHRTVMASNYERLAVSCICCALREIRGRAVPNTTRISATRHERQESAVTLLSTFDAMSARITLLY